VGKFVGRWANLWANSRQSQELVLTMHSDTCPSSLHFHVVFEQVGSLSRSDKTIISPSPGDALNDFLELLPEGWRGGVSIYDDEVGHVASTITRMSYLRFWLSSRV